MGCTASAQKASPRSGNLKDADPVSAKEVKEEAGPCDGGTIPKEEADKGSQEPDPTPVPEAHCHDDVQEDTPLEVKEIHQGTDKTDDERNSNTAGDVDASGDDSKDYVKETDENKREASEEEQILQDIEEQDSGGNTTETVNEDPKLPDADEQQDVLSPSSTDEDASKKSPEGELPDSVDTKEGAEPVIPQNADNNATDQTEPQNETSGNSCDNTDEVQTLAAAVSDTVDNS